jgi:hypothetical protein
MWEVICTQYEDISLYSTQYENYVWYKTQKLMQKCIRRLEIYLCIDCHLKLPFATPI